MLTIYLTKIDLGCAGNIPPNVTSLTNIGMSIWNKTQIILLNKFDMLLVEMASQ